MALLTVVRPFSSRLLHKVLRSIPLNGGYVLALMIGQQRFVIPVINGVINEGPDKALLQLYAGVLPALKGTFLDVGVNVGQTLLAVRAVAPKMQYLGFEPNVSCVAYTRSLMQRNGIEDMIVLPVALMEKTGLLELQRYSSSETDSSASLISNFRPEQTVRQVSFVPAFAWDQIASLFPDQKLAFVKIDVEGAESEVLISLVEVLKKQRPWVGVEILPVYEEGYSDRLERQKSIEAILNDAGYVILRVKRDRCQNLSHLIRLETIGIHSDLADCDYLLVPREDVQLLLTRPFKVLGID